MVFILSQIDQPAPLATEETKQIEMRISIHWKERWMDI